MTRYQYETIQQHSFPLHQSDGAQELSEFFLLANLSPTAFGYGVLHCIEEDDAQKHWTLVTTDVEYVRRLVRRPISEGFEIPVDKFRIQLGGWPEMKIKGH